ncbi:MAG: hypothetical protein ACRCTZ_18360 [Sarcina sp.]
MKKSELVELCWKNGVNYQEVVKYSNIIKNIYKKDVDNKEKK